MPLANEHILIASIIPNLGPQSYFLSGILALGPRRGSGMHRKLGTDDCESGTSVA